MSIADEVRDVLLSRLRKPLPEGRVIDERDRLADLGVDSISIAFVFAHFEKLHDVAFDNDELNPRQYETVRDLSGVVERRVAPQRR
jgi:acyl carrier protein